MSLRLVGDDRAVSQVIDFIVAMGIFAIVLGLFFVFAPSARQGGSGTSQRALAQATVDTLVGRPGLAEGSGTDWEATPEQVGALGLRQADGEALAYGKIVALTHGKARDVDNGYVDYPSAREALGLARLEVRHDFELTIRPRPIGNASTDDTDRIADARAAYIGSNETEQAMLDRMAVGFDTGEDVYAATDGGVDDLVGGLGLYNVLVVGSDADHAPLDRSRPRMDIRAWAEAGGGLVVLGSVDADPAWLHPMIGDLDYVAGSGSLEPVNASHALRATPHRLRVDAYAPEGGDAVWTTSSTPMSIAVRDADASRKLALGYRHIGDGIVALTTFQPAETDADGEVVEARELMANLVHVAATGATNLDYGLEPVFEARSASATRQVVVAHPRLGSVPSAVRVTVWGGG